MAEIRSDAFQERIRIAGDMFRRHEDLDSIVLRNALNEIRFREVHTLDEDITMNLCDTT